MDVFDALASATRRQILLDLSEGSLLAGEIADRFNTSRPAISRHLRILVQAGLLKRDRRGPFIRYALVAESLAETLADFVHQICPVGGRPRVPRN